MTPKQRVLKMYPKARSWQPHGERHWYIAGDNWTGGDLSIGVYFTARQAWASAARNLRGKK